MSVDLSVLFIYFIAGVFKHLVPLLLIMSIIVIFGQFFTYDRHI